MGRKITVSLIGVFFILVLVYLLYIESKCNATMTADGKLNFDGKTYQSVSYKEIGKYTETSHLLSKTELFGGYSVYEIKEYPDLEYVVVRAAWNAEIYKLHIPVQQEDVKVQSTLQILR